LIYPDEYDEPQSLTDGLRLKFWGFRYHLNELDNIDHYRHQRAINALAYQQLIEKRNKGDEPLSVRETKTFDELLDYAEMHISGNTSKQTD
jgi:hypothetical protein